MNNQSKNNYSGILNSDRKTLYLLGKSTLIGLLVGAVVVAYRLVLAQGEEISFTMYEWISLHSAWILPLFLCLCITGCAIGLLTKKYPLIGGSGIPQVKGIMLGYFENSWLSTLLAKFIGGAICIIGGLSLGREGPSIQLGACVADGVAQKLGTTRREKKILMASGASAGLAAAFNAPLAGVMFTLEEIFKYFSPSILLSTMTAAITADFVSKNVFGLSPVFDFPVNEAMPLTSYWILILLGILLGLAGAFYNFILLKTQAVYGKLPGVAPEARPVIAFVTAGILGLTFPVVLGGGHKLTALLTPSAGVSFLLGALAVKFIFSMVSFGCGAPGGIFFPLLVMGACVGAVFGNCAVMYLGLDGPLFYNFVILAMAGFFTAIVRAPITGIVLITEMTGSFSHLLSLSVVSLSAYIVADLLKSRPVYDSLLKNQLRSRKLHVTESEPDKKITFEFIVQLTSPIANTLVKDVRWPKGCLLVAVKREDTELIPNGNTKILPGDYLICLGPLSSETKIRSVLTRLTSSTEAN